MAFKPMKTINFGGDDTYYLKPEWENVENAPFGEITVMGDTVTWDLSTDGLECIELEIEGEMAHFYRVSDFVGTVEDFAEGGTLSATIDGIATPQPVPAEDFAILGDLVSPLDLYIIIALTDGASYVDGDFTLAFDKRGVYIMYEFCQMVGCSELSLTVNNYTKFKTKKIKPLDTKFLPESHQFGETIKKLNCGSDCFEYGGFEDDRTTLMVTKLVPIVIGNKCTVTINGTQYDCNVMDFGAAMEVPAGTFALATNAESLEEAESSAILAMLAITEDAAVMLGGYGQVMLLGEYDESVSVSIEQVATTIKTIDKKYIPNNGAVFSAASDTLTFVGDLSSRVVWSLGEGGIDVAAIVKLSNVAPTLEDLQKGGAVLSLLNDGTWQETAFDSTAVSVENGWIRLSVDIGFMIVEKPSIIQLSEAVAVPISEAGIYTMTLGGGGETLFLSSQGIRLNDYTGFITHEIENPNQRPVLSIDGVKPDSKGNVKIVHPEIPVVKIVQFTTTDGVTTTEEDLDDIQRLLAKDNAIVKARRQKPSTAAGFEFIFYEVTYYDRKPVSRKIQFERRNGSSTETIIWSNDGVTIG